jgi:DNA-directed RNA polymerase specialized sigma24 family protein
VSPIPARLSVDDSESSGRSGAERCRPGTGTSPPRVSAASLQFDDLTLGRDGAPASGDLMGTSAWSFGGCGSSRVLDYLAMADAASDFQGLLHDWVHGRVDRRQLYLALRDPMRQSARRGIRSIIRGTPPEHIVEDAVSAAFLELEKQDPGRVTSLVGLAKRIAYRRGQDGARSALTEHFRMENAVSALAVLTEPPLDDQETLATAEQVEILVLHALDCLDGLTDDQRSVISATVMAGENLSDWALRNGKSHQAASQQRSRALKALRSCVDGKLRFERVQKKEGRDERGA